MNDVQNNQNVKKSLIEWAIFATGIEVFIWGLVDPLYSVFINSVVNDYFLVGLIFAFKSAIGLLSIFFLHRILQHISSLQALFISYIMVFSVFIGFFIAGVTQSILVLLIASLINGIAFILRKNAKQDILMNEITEKNAGEVLGKNVATSYSFWAAGMITGGFILFVVEKISLPHAYLFTAGLWMSLYFIFTDKFQNFQKINISNIWKDIKDVVIKDKIFMTTFKKMKTYSSELNYSIILVMFMEMTSRISLLFVPLLAQDLGLPLFQIFLLSAFMLLPMVFTYAFSHLADKYNKLTLIVYGIALSLLPLIFLTTTNQPIEIAIASSVISLCLALLQPSVLGLAGSLAPHSEKHSVVQLELFFQAVGAIIGSVGLGTVAEIYGIQTAFLFVAIIATIFLCIAIYLHFHIEGKAEHEILKIRAKQNAPKSTFRKIIEHIHFDASRHTQ